METYLERFTQMVDTLRQHPNIQLLTFKTFPAATDVEIQAIETALGYTLAAPIKAFYQQTNGLQLRWIAKDNEHFDADKHRFHDTPIDWFHSFYDYWPEDGCVMLLPVKLAFLHDWNEQLYFDWMTNDQKEEFAGQAYPLLDFCKSLRPFDLFSKYNDMAFFLDGSANPPVIMGDDHQACYTDSRITDFASYLEFLIAKLGVVDNRRSFYGIYAGHEQPRLETDQSYWTPKSKLNIGTYLLKKIFPEVDQPGAATDSLNANMMYSLAKGSDPLSDQAFQQIIEQHHQFIQAGGAGGHWETLSVSGLVLGIYNGPSPEAGEQAGFERKHLPKTKHLASAELPFANFCACYCPTQDFSKTDLQHSLFTDSYLAESNFEGANLQGVDFSRAVLRDSNFANANLSGADFENCDLTGANFTGALLEGSRFPGAILDDVKY